MLLITFLQCRSLAYSWDQRIRGGSYVDGKRSFRWTGVVALLLDYLILFLTLPLIWRMKSRRLQKTSSDSTSNHGYYCHHIECLFFCRAFNTSRDVLPKSTNESLLDRYIFLNRSLMLTVRLQTFVPSEPAKATTSTTIQVITISTTMFVTTAISRNLLPVIH